MDEAEEELAEEEERKREATVEDKEARVDESTEPVGGEDEYEEEVDEAVVV